MLLIKVSFSAQKWCGLYLEQFPDVIGPLKGLCHSGCVPGVQFVTYCSVCEEV